MALTAGTRLGAYEIQSALGAGGMGEVYRARDAKLGRDVAIKVMADGFGDDPERIARFQREAQILAALNHQHIATIHGLEEASGTQFLVLELVDGETLAERIARRASGSGLWASGQSRGRAEIAGTKPAAESPKPHGARSQGLPLDEALHIAQQIADAL